MERSEGKPADLVSKHCGSVDIGKNAQRYNQFEYPAQVHYKTKIVRCTNVLMRIIDLLIMY